MSMTRTFHTVGQGAFYTERHTTKDDGKFIIVYDCGTANKKEILEKEITSTFSENDEIDILFISHFHNDHISGLGFLKKHCKKIKKVVLPYVDDDAKTILKVSNYLSCENPYSDLIDNPAAFFGEETVIITVRVNEGEESVSTEEDQNNNDIDNLPSSIASGTKITSKNLIEQEWFFIPFNYEHADRKKDFERELTKRGLCLADIDTTKKIQNKKANITAAYKAVKGDLNKTSMILFSGFGKSSYLTRCFSNNWHFPCPFCWFRTESGCIYFGDIDLNQVGIIENIKVRLRMYLPFVGTIQIPHHGSAHNFNSSILDGGKVKCAVISFGDPNRYRHPSMKVVKKILSLNVYPHLVTEEQDSVVIQHN